MHAQTDDTINIYPVPALRDNYIWAIIDPSKRMATIIDPGEAAPILNFLADENLTLNSILITHHHWDHTNGIDEITQQHPVPVYGPDNSSIKGLTNLVREGDTVDLAPLPFKFDVMAIPGHTLDHLAYYTPGILFCGDTLFASGCGRIFEGTGQQMYATLQKIYNLPDTTKIYCAHEYTENNLQFAKQVEPNNQSISDYANQVAAQRKANKVTLPTLLSIEKEMNPFLRCEQPEVLNSISQHTGKAVTNPDDVFIELRKWKDSF